MKELIFIDNDDLEMAEKDAVRAERHLRLFGNLETFPKMRVVPHFRFLDKQQKMNLLFSGDHVIVTYSMYTDTHHNSLGQLMEMLFKASTNGVTGISYICTSGEIIEALNRNIRDDERAGRIMHAVETNTIAAYRDGSFHRVRVRLTPDYDWFAIEPIELKDLL